MSVTTSLLNRIGLPLYRRYVFQPSDEPWEWPSESGSPETWETVRCRRADGFVVAGLYGQAEGLPKGTVVCAHPFKRSGKGFFLKHGHAAMLRQAGYHVLLFDFSGFGETELQSVLFPQDVLAAGWEARRRAPHLPVALLGVCFGAVYSTCAFSAAAHPFTAAILDSPYASAPEALEAMTGQVPWPRFHQVQKAVVRLTRPFYPALDPLRHARRATGLKGVLMISGEEDSLSPTEGVLCYVPAFEQAGVPCSAWTAPNAEHLDAFITDPESYAGRVLSFLDAHLPQVPRPRRFSGRSRWLRKGRPQTSSPVALA